MSQAYAGLDTNKAVGVMGDTRVYGYIVILRAVTTSDFMSAEPYEFSFDLLNAMARRIVNEMDGVSRATYDLQVPDSCPHLESLNSNVSLTPKPSHNISGPIKNGEWLKVDKSLWSPDGSVDVKMHEDGKLAVYWEGDDNDGNAVWASDTAEPPRDSTIEVSVQDDGNEVFYKKTAIECSETHK
ncbi:hypothetical protein QQZ08_005119 [Neonectria magnoliae]|uniref:Bulb-type lectin domain-containing protein n=1 Tax=Neonectria magnoliae TaxID=2732573 RepID=A0ABR1I5Z1_9HYPO